MKDRFKFRIPMFTDKGSFMEFQYIELGDGIECTLCGYNGEPQQCTGLKDKNGKLIYEGDILQSEEYPFKNERGYNYAAEVLWDDVSATFYYYTFRISNNVTGRSTGNTGELNEYEDWKVIGNIYENKSLLESEG